MASPASAPTRYPLAPRGWEEPFIFGVSSERGPASAVVVPGLDAARLQRRVGDGVKRRVAAKLALARALRATGVERALLAAQTARLGTRFIRVVNYHDTPPAHAESLRRQMEFYRRHFAPVRHCDLDGFLARGQWSGEMPGLILSFDDGLRSNYDVAFPLLEEFGFVGWFFVPTDFVDAPAPTQVAFARGHRIGLAPASVGEGRVAMSWTELRRLCERHVVGCHTRTHRRLVAATPAAQLDDEIVVAKGTLEERLGGPIDAFCWVGGEERTYSAPASRRVRAAGYRFSFMTCSSPVTPRTDPLQLHRTNVEASWPLDLVRLQLCGVADWANARKRRRVDRITA